MVDRISVPATNSANDRVKPVDAPPDASAVSRPSAGSSPFDRLALLVRRDDAAYEELVRLHGPRMHALARRYLGNHADADDAVQDAFVALYRGIRTFDGRSSVETWLHRIVVNRAIDMLRRRTRRLEVTISAPEHACAAERSPRASPVASAESVAAVADSHRHVIGAVGRLSPVQRVVIRLCDIEGLGLDATALALGVKPSTVRVRLHRARRTLRAQLAGHAAP